MPKQDAGHNRGHAYPFMSCEIFNCEINSIFDQFFQLPDKKLPISDKKADMGNHPDSDCGKSDSDDGKKGLDEAWEQKKPSIFTRKSDLEVDA